MASKPPPQARRSADRSPAQQDWNAVVGHTAKLWERLTDEERLAWRVWGKARRRNGYNCFLGANV